jgi:hypothetical protein
MVAPVGAKASGGAEAWWFADHRARAVAGARGQHRLHASKGIAGALLRAKTPFLCRVRLEGATSEVPGGFEADSYAVAWSVDAREIVRVTLRAELDRLLENAGASSDVHRERAAAARERAIASEERMRNALWVALEGRGARDPIARAKASGEAEGARFTTQELRAAAYAHEAAAALCDASELGGLVRALELLIEAHAQLERDPLRAKERVQAALDRALERRVQESKVESARGDEAIAPARTTRDPGRHLLSALERCLAPHHGILGVHPLALPPQLFPILPNGGVAVFARVANEPTGRALAASFDRDRDLAPLNVWIACSWSESLEEAELRGCLATSAALAPIEEESPLSDLRVRLFEAIARAATEPEISRTDDTSLWRARLACEPAIDGAARIAIADRRVLALELREPDEGVVARIAAFEPACVAIAGERVLYTRAGRDAFGGGDIASLVRDLPLESKLYARGFALARPHRSAPPKLWKPSRPWKQSDFEMPRRAAPRPYVARVEPPPLAQARADSHAPPARADARVPPAWAEALRALCEAAGGVIRAWPIAPGEALEKTFRTHELVPVAVLVRDHAALTRVLDSMELDRALRRSGLGLVVLPAAVDRGDVVWALDPRLRSALTLEERRALFDGAMRALRAPNLAAHLDELESFLLELRWILTRDRDVECAGWIDAGLLAVLRASGGEGADALAREMEKFPQMGLAQVWPSDGEAVHQAVEHGRYCVHRTERAVTLDRYCAHLATAFAAPAVYERERMLAAPLA